VLEEYDDSLPAPARVGFDASRQPFPLDDPVLFELEGTGAPLRWAGAGLALPNRLSLWLDRLGDFAPVVRIQVQGEAYPRAAWENQRQRQKERITLVEEGYDETDTIWESVESVEVFGLPTRYLSIHRPVVT